MMETKARKSWERQGLMSSKFLEEEGKENIEIP
jgi:hypothetical protein